MSFAKGLSCRECHREYEASPEHICEFCFGPLEVIYDYEGIIKNVDREKIASGPISLWRYKDFLPVEGHELIDLSAGFTPLLKANNLGKLFGLKHLYLKNDTVNPTFSFKDRVVTVALTKAKEFGYDTVACASTGNLANSVSAHAAYASLKAYIFIPADLEKNKIISSAIYKPNLVKIKGTYDDVNRLCSEIASIYPWAFVNVNIRPYYAEGSKTLGFETVEQLRWQVPDHLIIPVASGSLLTKIYQGIKEFSRVGLVKEKKFRVSGAQAEGCSPVVTAFKNKTLNIRPVKPETIAKSLAIGNPADGYYALKIINETGGFAESVNDEEIVEGIKLLAENEGIFAETAGGVTIAVLKKAVLAGQVEKNEVVVAYITGIGLKTTEPLEKEEFHSYEINPSFDDFEEQVIGEKCRARL